MASLPAPALNWLDSPEPQSATSLVSYSSMGATAPVPASSTQIPAPEIGGGDGDASVGVAM